MSAVFSSFNDYCATWRSSLNLTVEALIGFPLANVSPSRRIQVQTVSGARSAPPGEKLMRNGKTWVSMLKDPLS